MERRPPSDIVSASNALKRGLTAQAVSGFIEAWIRECFIARRKP